LRTPNCVAIEVLRAFSGALRRPHCADPQQQACMALNYRYQHCAVPAVRCPSCCAPSSSCSSLSLLLCCCHAAVAVREVLCAASQGLNACIPDGMLGTLLLARNIVLPLLPLDGTHIPIHYPEFITLINFAIAHNCAPALTGIISRLHTRLRTLISSVVKYSLHVFIAPKKIIKAQWSSVGTVYTTRFGLTLYKRYITAYRKCF
jgi:hypothetical protein